jgi:hypothetical protein
VLELRQKICDVASHGVQEIGSKVMPCPSRTLALVTTFFDTRLDFLLLVSLFQRCLLHAHDTLEITYIHSISGEPSLRDATSTPVSTTDMICSRLGTFLWIASHLWDREAYMCRILAAFCSQDRASPISYHQSPEITKITPPKAFSFNTDLPIQCTYLYLALSK